MTFAPSPAKQQEVAEGVMGKMQAAETQGVGALTGEDS